MSTIGEGLPDAAAHHLGMATDSDGITRFWRCALGDAGLRNADDAVLPSS
jgi:hypothetical protein